METCNLIKPTRHGKETLGKGIQSNSAKEVSSNINLTYLSGDDTKLGTDHTKADVYESSDNVSVSSSISENQIQSDSDLEDDLFSLAEDNEICSDSDVPDSEVPDPWDKWEDVDLASCCVFDEMPLETCDDDESSRPIDFVSSSTDDIDYATEFLKGYSTLKQLLSADLPDDCNDANSIWSILTNKLLYCQSDTSDSVRYFSYDSLKAKSAKQRFFDAALNNEPCSNKSYFDSCNIEYCNVKDLYRDQLYDAVPIPVKNPKKKTLNTAEATASSNVPTKKIFPQYVENKYEDLEVHTSYKFDPAKSICATYLWTENVGYPKELVTATAYNTEGYKLWFKQGRFPIGIDGEATAHLLDNTPIPVKTLIDSGASKPILNKHFYAHPFLHTYPRYKIATRGMVIGNDTVLPCNEAIAIMVKFSGHVFHMICYLLECSKDYGLYIGQNAMYELEGGADFRNLSFHFLMRSLNLYAEDTVKIKPGQSKMVPLCIDTHAMERSSQLRERKLLDIDLYKIEKEKVIINLKSERKD